MMANLRFEWINWKSKTVRFSEKPYGSVLDVQTAKATKSTDKGKPYGTPLPSVRSAPYVRTRRVRAESGHGARAAAHYAGERPHAGVEGGQRVMCDGGRVAKAPIEDEEQLAALEQLEAEHGSMAEAIRYAIEQAAADAETPDSEAGLPKAAREGYAALREHANVGERLALDAAEGIISQRVQLRKETVRSSVIRKLHGAGWIDVEQGIHEVGVVVLPRTASDGGRDTDAGDEDRDRDADDVAEADNRLDELAAATGGAGE